MHSDDWSDPPVRQGSVTKPYQFLCSGSFLTFNFALCIILQDMRLHET